jgi:hypothetical protein
VCVSTWTRAASQSTRDPFIQILGVGVIGTPFRLTAAAPRPPAPHHSG